MLLLINNDGSQPTNFKLQAYNELIEVKKELEALKSEHLLFQYARDQLDEITPDGADDLLSLLAKTIAAAVVPFEHCAWGDLRIMLANMQQPSRHAFRYNESVLSRLTVAITQGSASRAFDQFFTGADGAEHPNHFGTPTSKYI